MEVHRKLLNAQEFMQSIERDNIVVKELLKKMRSGTPFNPKESFQHNHSSIVQSFCCASPRAANTTAATAHHSVSNAFSPPSGTIQSVLSVGMSPPQQQKKPLIASIRNALVLARKKLDSLEARNKITRNEQSDAKSAITPQKLSQLPIKPQQKERVQYKSQSSISSSSSSSSSSQSFQQQIKSVQDKEIVQAREIFLHSLARLSRTERDRYLKAERQEIGALQSPKATKNLLTYFANLMDRLVQEKNSQSVALEQRSTQQSIQTSPIGQKLRTLKQILSSIPPDNLSLSQILLKDNRQQQQQQQQHPIEGSDASRQYYLGQRTQTAQGCTTQALLDSQRKQLSFKVSETGAHYSRQDSNAFTDVPQANQFDEYLLQDLCIKEGGRSNVKSGNNNNNNGRTRSVQQVKVFQQARRTLRDQQTESLATVAAEGVSCQVNAEETNLLLPVSMATLDYFADDVCLEKNSFQDKNPQPDSQVVNLASVSQQKLQQTPEAYSSSVNSTPFMSPLHSIDTNRQERVQCEQQVSVQNSAKSTNSQQRQRWNYSTRIDKRCKTQQLQEIGGNCQWHRSGSKEYSTSRTNF